MAGTAGSGTGQAVLAGAGAALAGAAVWAVLQTVTGYEIGYAAVGIGLLVGLVVGRLGRGPSAGPLPVVAAVLAVLGALLGDLVGFAGLLDGQLADEGYAAPSLLSVLGHLVSGSDLALGGDLLLDVRGVWVDELSPLLALFAVLAAAAAYRTSRGLLADREQEQRPFPAPVAPPAYAPPTGPAQQL